VTGLFFMKTLKYLTLAILIFGLISCEKWFDDSSKKQEIVAPNSFTIFPDSVASTKEKVWIKFDYALINSCKEYNGYKIVSQTDSSIEVQLITIDNSEPGIHCATVITYNHDTIGINLGNNSTYNVKFLDGEHSVFLTRKVNVSNDMNSNFVIKFENEDKKWNEYYKDTISLVLHDDKNIKESNYTDTTFIDSNKDFIAEMEAPSNYKELYYSIIRYSENCDSSQYICHSEIDILSGVFTVKRGVPEVIKIHRDIY